MKRVYWVLAAIAIVSGACNKPPATPPLSSEGENADSADQIVQGFFKYDVVKGGVLVSHVEGDSGKFYKSSQTWKIKGIKVIFPDSTGRTISVIQARNGEFKMINDSTSLVARDSVVGTTPQGKVLKTQHLIWDQSSNLLSSDSSFVLTSPTDPPVIRGASFSSTTDFTSVHNYKASGRITGSKPAPVKPKGKTPPKNATPARGGVR